MSNGATDKSIVDDAWDSAVGGLEWLQSVIFGEFAEHRSRSALVADMLLNFAPGVVIVTSARDAVAVITYRLMPGPSQGLPFVACPNCAAILPKEAYIPTGRLGP